MHALQAYNHALNHTLIHSLTHSDSPDDNGYYIALTCTVHYPQKLLVFLPNAKKQKNAENAENRKMQEILKSKNQSFFPQEPIYM